MGLTSVEVKIKSLLLLIYFMKIESAGKSDYILLPFVNRSRGKSCAFDVLWFKETFKAQVPAYELSHNFKRKQ